MKNNLENNFKESLRNFEVPYNKAAWTSMNAKLNEVMPTGIIGGANYKWIAAISAIVITAASVLYIYSSDKNLANNKVRISEDGSTNKTSNNKNELTTTTSNENDRENKITDQASSVLIPSTNKQDLEHNIESGASDIELIENLDIPPINDTDQDASNQSAGENLNPNQNKSIILPSLVDICAGEKVKIHNSNDVSLTIEGANLQILVTPNTTKTVSFNAPGTYKIYGISDAIETETFNVKTLPKVDFIIDNENSYEGGLPVTFLTATDGQNVTWTFNGINATGQNTNAHFFTKGNHEITLSTNGSNGCKNTVAHDHYVKTDYNLMAVNSFIPNDSDPRNNTFMPYALTQRNVKFNLIIIDPTDGRTVYQTNDFSRGWDGTDRKTGQAVKYQASYIWKVVLENPERGERNEYAGNIIPISK